MISKELWIENITDFLKQIASAEFQEKGWIMGEIHDYCSFVETISGLFTDSDFENFIDNYAKGFRLSDEQIEKLDKVRHACNAYVDQHSCYEDPAVIVKDPQWHKIRKMAKDALQSLHMEKYLDPSKDVIKAALLSSIKAISSSKLQEKSWFEYRKPNENPFKNLLRNFFENPQFIELIANYKDYEIIERQYENFMNLYRTLKIYREKKGDERDLRKIFDDPEWHQIRIIAKTVLREFEYKDFDGKGGYIPSDSPKYLAD